MALALSLTGPLAGILTSATTANADEALPNAAPRQSASDHDSPLYLARLTLPADVETQLGRLHGPLLGADADRYARIFKLQESGRWGEADALIEQLSNRLLLGHVLAQRFMHPTAYVSTYAELHDWLTDYADLPGARAIYRLATSKRHDGAAAPPEPVAGYLGGSGQELIEERGTSYVSPLRRSAAVERNIADWRKRVGDLVRRDRPSRAAETLSSPAARAADPVEFDLARWMIARGYFANRMDKEAYAFASEAAGRSGSVEPRMHMTAGLAAWRLGEVEAAAAQFAALARSEAPGEERAMGGFWAARAYQQLRAFDRHLTFLRIAALASDDFYGQLAQALIGASSDFDWHEDGLGRDMRRLISQFPGAQRAMALAQVGRADLAAKEIRKLAARARPQLTRALAALAESLALPAAQMRVAQRLRLQDGRRHDGAMYPVPPWQPEGGFSVDKALLYALIRAESGFDPLARSHAGARGLMQILPSTAKAMAPKADIAFNDPDSMYVPRVNLSIGQAYVQDLLDNHLVEGSLLHLAIAYNAGLKRLDAWVPRYKDISDDPLLFIESIPVPETRAYVRKVMANFWAYRARLDQERTSLTQLASSAWPSYAPQEPAALLAWNR